MLEDPAAFRAALRRQVAALEGGASVRDP